ncbi:unnamed protein product [Caenorhabditis auriculariae]|uniref:Cyclin-like domain-containing protein n=1 Tax=Caenorhabditis auriculariae TaxID=2777116 RepID=A0A8S1HYE8_9PELO|nr:unnamed protein product [Caenorhabditis auriculariae]
MAANFWNSSQNEQWMFDKSELMRSRSEDLKIYTEEEYAKFMIFWANYIQAICTEGSAVSNNCVKTRILVCQTATVYFKRFYTRRSFKDMDPFLVGATAIYLASKVDEMGPLSLTSLIKNVGHVLQKRWPMIAFDPSPSKNAAVYDGEFILLEIMDCCLIVYHPHRPMNIYLQDLQKEHQLKEFDQLEAQCWKVANDTLRCDVCLLFPPHIIGIACIIVGAELMNREKDIKTWLPELSVDFEKVGECVQMIFNMYKLWKAFDEREQIKALVSKLPKIAPGPNGPFFHQHYGPKISMY